MISYGLRLKNRYCKVKILCTIAEDSNSSYTWKLLLKSRPQSKELMERRIVNEHNTCLWFTPTINGQSLKALLGYKLFQSSGTQQEVSSPNVLEDSGEKKY